uniref:BTB domain-containing protein n=1 Tax=Strigamia maritima TaxID=126957 RepID=T1JFA7_STRMM
MGSQQQFCLRWNNHQTNMIGVFDNLLQSETLVDVTLACDGFSLKAHKVVLSACSPYFQSLFLDNPCKHPIVILKDVKFSDLRALIDFMYRGEVNVSQDQLSALLATAETLKVKGLAEVTSGMNDKDLEAATNSTQQSAILPQDENISSRSSPAPKRKRIRLRRRSGGGSAVSDTEDEVQEVVPLAQPVDLLEAKVEINENNYTSCSQASGEVPVPVPIPIPIPIQDQSAVGGSPAEPAQIDLSPITVNAESVFPSGSIIDIAKELASKANSTVTVIPTDARRTNPVISTIKSSGLPVSNVQPTTSTPLPSTSGTQQVMASGQDSSRSRRMVFSYGSGTKKLSRNGIRYRWNSERACMELSSWNEMDMQAAIDGIRNKTMTLTEAAIEFNVPRNTLWYRARRSGIDTNVKKA